MDPTSESTIRPKRFLATIVICTLVFIAAIFNVVWAKLVAEGQPNDLILCILTGIGIAEVALIATWCGLGIQKIVMRIPLSMGVLICLACIFIGVMISTDRGPVPLEVPIVYLSITIVQALLIQIPMWIFRVTTRLAIVPQGIAEIQTSDSQFGIKHLMIATSVAAILVAVVQQLFRHGEFDGDVGWIEILGFVCTLELFISLATLLCVSIVFSNRSRLAIGIALGSFCLLGPLSVREVLGVVDPSSRPSSLLNLYGFSLSLILTTIVFLFVFYAIGYRLSENRAPNG